MTNAAKTINFFEKTDAATVSSILDNIAKHYGITSLQALNEVTDDEAEHLLDYVTGAQRSATSLLMKRHGFA